MTQAAAVSNFASHFAAPMYQRAVSRLRYDAVDRICQECFTNEDHTASSNATCRSIRVLVNAEARGRIARSNGRSLILATAHVLGITRACRPSTGSCGQARSSNRFRSSSMSRARQSPVRVSPPAHPSAPR